MTKKSESIYVGGTQSFTYYSKNMSPTCAFKFKGIEFWGSAKTNLDKLTLETSDLIVNLTGMSYSIKPFVMNGPDWLKINEKYSSLPEQLLLDWKDFGIPPVAIDLNFWKGIFTQAKNKKIKRIICCCGAGQGRTGTALAAFALATGFSNDPEEVVDFIRDVYSDDAIETTAQVTYVYKLVYDIENISPGDDLYQSIVGQIKAQPKHTSTVAPVNTTYTTSTAAAPASVTSTTAIVRRHGEYEAPTVTDESRNKKIHELTQEEWEKMIDLDY
jgi:Protein-tyrosine phosphatase